MKNIWRINYHYDNGQGYEDHYTYDRVEYVQGTADDVRKYLAETTGYDANNLVDFDVTEMKKRNCYCPRSISKDYPVKATYSECDRDDWENNERFDFYQEDGNKIIFAYVENAFRDDDPKYDIWETNEYIAIPTTLDKIVKIL